MLMWYRVRWMRNKLSFWQNHGIFLGTITGFGFNHYMMNQLLVRTFANNYFASHGSSKSIANLCIYWKGIKQSLFHFIFHCWQNWIWSKRMNWLKIDFEWVQIRLIKGGKRCSCVMDKSMVDKYRLFS